MTSLSRFSLYYYSGLGDIARKEETILIIDTRSFTGKVRRDSFVDSGDSNSEDEEQDLDGAKIDYLSFCLKTK